LISAGGLGAVLGVRPRAFEHKPTEESATLKRVRQATRHEIWRVAHPCQYVGRVLRPTATKSRVEVHDYVDVYVPQLARMHDERRTAYAALGFNIPRTGTRRSGTKR
jgi:hypothetical protein